ncbi:MAG: hypothetical protein LBI53_07150 [Candidatus Peribacteria bacterium]|jgi:hypothetical protein|nr:hypothetical protein [Candidatus Peribacteria bacterium]
MDVDINDLSLQIMISMLPRSLFSEKNIVLSVVSEIIHEKDRPYMEIFLHEMSHLLRNNIMKQFPNEAELSPLAKEDLKEIMAPVILRDKHFDAILDSKHFRQANQKQEMLTIGVGKDIFTIVNYFEDIYQRGKKE